MKITGMTGQLILSLLFASSVAMPGNDVGKGDWGSSELLVTYHSMGRFIVLDEYVMDLGIEVPQAIQSARKGERACPTLRDVYPGSISSTRAMRIDFIFERLCEEVENPSFREGSD